MEIVKGGKKLKRRVVLNQKMVNMNTRSLMGVRRLVSTHVNTAAIRNTQNRRMMMATKEQIEAVLSTLLDEDAVPSNEQIGRIIDAANAPLLEAKDQAYHERNHLVAALARLYPSGVTKTDIPGWDDEWHGCVYIDLPTGQISYHFHDSEAQLFDGLPAYDKPWDGHSKDDVHARLAGLSNAPLLEALRVAYGELSECYDLEDPVSYVTMLDTVCDVLAALRPFLIEEGKDA